MFAFFVRAYTLSDGFEADIMLLGGLTMQVQLLHANKFVLTPLSSSEV